MLEELASGGPGSPATWACTEATAAAFAATPAVLVPMAAVLAAVSVRGV